MYFLKLDIDCMIKLLNIKRSSILNQIAISYCSLLNRSPAEQPQTVFLNTYVYFPFWPNTYMISYYFLMQALALITDLDKLTKHEEVEISCHKS